MGGGRPSHMVQLDLLHKRGPPQPPSLLASTLPGDYVLEKTLAGDIGGGQGDLWRCSLLPDASPTAALGYSCKTLTAPADLPKEKQQASLRSDALFALFDV